MRRFLFGFTALVFILNEPGNACLWDRDTTSMENQRFPNIHELIAGHFIRHSKAYYEWRVEQMESIPKPNRIPADYDDLAVAYDKLKQQEKAIDTITEKQKRWPIKGRYETEANLGTFLIHSGQFKEGLVHINKAIEINSEAHFGREIYQKILVEYILKKQSTGNTLPLNPKDSSRHRSGFAEFVLNSQKTNKENKTAEINNATKGVLGMMRFGNYDSPILLEVLGDLLLFGSSNKNANQLAARAYLKASYEVHEATAITAYKQKAARVISDYTSSEIFYIERNLKKEIEQGTDFFNQIIQDELAWTQTGIDVDEQFEQKYFRDPLLNRETPFPGVYSEGTEKRSTYTLILSGTGLLVLIILVRYLVTSIRKRKSPLSQ